MSEVKEILDCLGRGTRNSEVRDTHLSIILTYLHGKKTEEVKKTINKLTVLCGMGRRNVRENYFEGIADFGIIEIKVENNKEVWFWIGKKAFGRNNGNGDGT